MIHTQGEMIDPEVVEVDDSRDLNLESEKHLFLKAKLDKVLVELVVESLRSETSMINKYQTKI